MVIARQSTWSFKDGKRDEVFQLLDSSFGKFARDAKGFRGVITLLDKDDPNVGVVITLWTDEESFRASEQSVLNPAVRSIMKELKEPVTVKNYRVFTAELRHLVPPSEY